MKEIRTKQRTEPWVNETVLLNIKERNQVFHCRGFQLYFPDPWHKKKHHKRRIVQQHFIRQISSKLKPGGLCHMATDWAEYAQHMMEVMNF